MCDKRGNQITTEQLLWRHLIEGWLDNTTGHPTSQGFRPMRAEDELCLSVDQSKGGNTAESAFKLSSAAPPAGLGNYGIKSTWALSVSEVTEVGLQAWEDPEPARNGMPANPHHAVIGFEQLGNNDQTRVARKLKAKAILRGRQHPPPAA